MTPGSFHADYESLDRAIRSAGEPWTHGGQEETEAHRDATTEIQRVARELCRHCVFQNGEWCSRQPSQQDRMMDPT